MSVLSCMKVSMGLFISASFLKLASGSALAPSRQSAGQEGETPRKPLVPQHGDHGTSVVHPSSMGTQANRPVPEDHDLSTVPKPKPAQKRQRKSTPSKKKEIPDLIGISITHTEEAGKRVLQLGDFKFLSTPKRSGKRIPRQLLLRRANRGSKQLLYHEVNQKTHEFYQKPRVKITLTHRARGWDGYLEIKYKNINLNLKTRFEGNLSKVFSATTWDATGFGDMEYLERVKAKGSNELTDEDKERKSGYIVKVKDITYTRKNARRRSAAKKAPAKRTLQVPSWKSLRMNFERENSERTPNGMVSTALFKKVTPLEQLVLKLDTNKTNASEGKFVYTAGDFPLTSMELSIERATGPHAWSCELKVSRFGDSDDIFQTEVGDIRVLRGYRLWKYIVPTKDRQNETDVTRKIFIQLGNVIGA